MGDPSDRDLELGHLGAGDRFVVSVSPGGLVGVLDPADSRWSKTEVGAHAIEVSGLVVDVVERAGPCVAARGALRPASGLGKRRFALRGEVLAMPADGSQGVAFSRARLESPAKHERFFRARSGRWLVVEVLDHGLHPRAAHLDAFTTEVPCEGSFVISVHGCLHEVVGGPVDPWVIEWTLRHFTSGYYTPIVLERMGVIDHGALPEGVDVGEDPRAVEATRGQVHVHLQRPGGGAHLEHVCGRLEDARRFVDDRPGRWLLSSVADFVSVH